MKMTEHIRGHGAKRLLVALVGALVMMGMSPTPALASGAARVDVYVWNGYSSRPCIRAELNDGSGDAIYTCRNYDSTQADPAGTGGYLNPYTDVLTDGYMPPGVEGGDYYWVETYNGTLYEGCEYQMYDPNNPQWYCSAFSHDGEINRVSTDGSQYYVNSVDRWATDATTAYSCLSSAFSGDAYGIAGCFG
jgi:hypothetical protein